MDTSRTEILIGPENLLKIKKTHAAVFGIGGVGGYVVEALVRAGIGELSIYDFDSVSPSNINRQIFALQSTMKEKKVEVAKKRIFDINPSIKLHHYDYHLKPDNIQEVIKDIFDYAVDAIDEVDSKVTLLKYLKEQNIFTVSSMGAGSRINPSSVKIADLSKTNYCPLAKVVRKKLREINITSGITCVYSEETPHKSLDTQSSESYSANSGKRRVLGSISYMPAIFGLTAAGIIINNIIES